MKKTFDTDVDYFDEVVLKHDPEKLKRMVLRFSVSSKSVMTELQCGTVSSWHYQNEFEKLTENKN